MGDPPPRRCSIEGCPFSTKRLIDRSGWGLLCGTHYLRVYKGRPIDGPPPSTYSLEGHITRKRVAAGYICKEDVIEMYLSGESSDNVGEKFGIDKTTVLAWVKQAGHEVRKVGNKVGVKFPTGSDSPAWKGGRVVKAGGYIEIQLYPGDPYYEMGNTRFKNGPESPSSCHVLEHRYVMAQKLRRCLIRSENVHHINGDRGDNRIENLELWNTSQPSGQRIPDKVVWAKELLALYEPEALAS